MIKVLARFFSNDEGVTAIEYALIAALVSVASIATLDSLGRNFAAMLNKVSANLS